MPRFKTAIARFDKGLVTDRFVKGGLLECHDVIPLPTNGGWRVRGGKRAIAIANSTQGGVLHPGPNPSGTNQLHAGSTISGVFRTFSWDALNGTTLILEQYALNPAGTPVSLPGVTNSLTSLLACTRFGNENWYLPGSFNASCASRYAGAATTTTQYATGTVATTAGSNVVTGTSTAWTTGTNVRAGQYITINDASVQERNFRILRVLSSTQIVVDRPMPMTASGMTYRMLNNSWWSVKAGTFGNTLAPGSAITSFSTMMARVSCQHQGRMIVGGVVDADNTVRLDRLRWSAAENETDAVFGGTGIWGGAEYFHPNAYTDCFPGSSGASTSTSVFSGITALASFGGVLFIFKHNGVYALRGSLETDGRDTGYSIDLVTDQDGVWAAGYPVVTTAQGIYWAGSKGVYLMTASSLKCITDEAGINAHYNNDYVRRYASWKIKGYTGDRLILQAGYGTAFDPLTGEGSAASRGFYNTLIYYPRLGVWCTQTTPHGSSVLSATNQLGANDEVSIIDGTIDTAYAALGGQGLNWGADTDFGQSSYAPDAVNTAGFGRMEIPQLALTTQPIPLRGDPNGRVRAAQVKAKLVDNTGTAALQVQVVLGEEGTRTGPEANIIGQNTFGATLEPTEKWLRLNVRGGAPPVDNVRLQIRLANQSFDCRVYEAEVEHVAVARSRS